MKRFIFFNIIVVIGLFASCNKIELEPVDGEPVFSTEADFDGSKLSWQAGIEGYYMFSNFEKDPAEIFVFSGKFDQEIPTNCCKNTLEFQIRDARQTQGNSTEINAAISTDIDYYFADFSGSDTTYVVVNDTIWLTKFFVNSYSNTQQQLFYEWDFGDTQNDSSFVDSITHNYDLAPDNQVVTLSAKTLNNNSSSYFSRVISASNSTNAGCNLSLTPDSVSFNQIIISASATGTAPFTYLWSDSTNASVFFADPSSITGQFEAWVMVTDSEGCTISAGLSSTLTPGTIPPICVATFDYNIQEIIEPDSQIIINPIDSQLYSAVTIIHEDELGKQYRSDRQTQPQLSSFRIISVEDYDNNEKGQKTKKISIVYSCRLWDEQGNFIDVTNGKATVAIAYP